MSFKISSQKKIYKSSHPSWAYWRPTIIPGTWEAEVEDGKFEPSLDNLAEPPLKIKT